MDDWNHARITDRALGALVGLAVGDALGAPVESCRRDSFAPVTDMRAGGYFKLPAGAWTDDTAKALCLGDNSHSCAKSQQRRETTGVEGGIIPFKLVRKELMALMVSPKGQITR
jgi:ADP-ribosylglycohydrolase